MNFILQCPKYKSEKKFIIDTRMFALFAIKKYRFNANEIILDRYLRHTYKISLRGSCLLIVTKLKFMRDNDGYLVGTTYDRRLDKLAALIIYGNGVVKGSNILNVALGK